MKDETVFDPVTGKHLKSSSLARREKRAAFRAVKDRAKNEQAERLRKEAADADAERIHRERIALIVSELTPPILPDEPLCDTNDQDIPGTSWWAYVLQNLDDYLTPLEKQMDFERLYYSLANSIVGELILEYFGVPLPSLPRGWCYLTGNAIQIFKQPYGPTFEVWEDPTLEEMEKTAVWWTEANDARKKISAPTREIMSDEMKQCYAGRADVVTEQCRIETAEKKRRYAERLRNLESKYLAARNAMRLTTLSAAKDTP